MRKSIRRKPVIRRRSKRRTRRSVRRVPRTVGPPSSMMTKLNYTNIQSGVVGTATSYAYTFRLNSLYDPDLTGTGYQPHYHDQFSAMYTNYRVYGCKVLAKVSIASANANMYAPTVAMIPLNSGTLSYGTFENSINIPRAQFKNIVPNTNALTFKGYFSVAALEGVAKRIVSTDDQYAALCTTNPVKVPTLTFIVYNNDLVTNCAFTWEVRFTFYAKYFTRTTPGAS